jgi:hypothetical protein
MLKVHQNAPTSMLKSENFSGVIPPDPRIKRGGEGREELGRVGKGGNSCLAHPKIILWRPLCFSGISLKDEMLTLVMLTRRLKKVSR